MLTISSNLVSYFSSRRSFVLKPALGSVAGKKHTQVKLLDPIYTLQTTDKTDTTRQDTIYRMISATGYTAGYVKIAESKVNVPWHWAQQKCLVCQFSEIFSLTHRSKFKFNQY